jgi:hypothetical protein
MIDVVKGFTPGELHLDVSDTRNLIELLNYAFRMPAGQRLAPKTLNVVDGWLVNSLIGAGLVVSDKQKNQLVPTQRASDGVVFMRAAISLSIRDEEHFNCLHDLVCSSKSALTKFQYKNGSALSNFAQRLISAMHELNLPSKRNTDDQDED